MTVIKNETLLSTIVEPHVTEKTMRMSGNNRPRINKIGSQMDTDQKSKGIYYGV